MFRLCEDTRFDGHNEAMKLQAERLKKKTSLLPARTVQVINRT